MIRRRAALAATIPAVVGLLATGGCSKDEKGLGDAPVGERHETEREVWLAPDLFPNIAAWCIGVNGIYVTTREAPPTVVTDDPNCEEGGELRADGGG
jgi:hypothetical protein